MEPYTLINHITEDILSSHFKNNYCLLYFPDNIRYNHTLQDHWEFLHDKHLEALPNSRTHKNPNTFEKGSKKYFFHNEEWIYGLRNPDKLRKYTSYNFYQHSWEPIDVNMDKFFWNFIEAFNDNRHAIVIHSELNSKSIAKLAEKNIKNIHWFAHAYLCSEFYFKHYQKLKIVTDYKARPIKYRWLSANRLLRQHRTDLLELLDLEQGCYSLANPDPNGLKYTGPVPAHSFDTHGNQSAEISVDDLNPWNTSFLHVVNETVWQDKIHFTEKIFKPIVLHQPFVVVQAPGSLKYLRNYGFKTFGDWWDESYDDIQDPTQRLQAIAKIINDIGGKDISELEKLRMEMAGVLEHNFHHFYENIPAIVLGELENNIRLLS